jgi:hypothetical protein
MKVEDSRGFYFVAAPKFKEPNYRVTTYNEWILHLVHGHCRMVIQRAVGNDSRLKARMTKEALEAHEPSVGMWPGDIIEYFEPDGRLIERIS